MQHLLCSQIGYVARLKLGPTIFTRIKSLNIVATVTGRIFIGAQLHKRLAVLPKYGTTKWRITNMATDKAHFQGQGISSKLCGRGRGKLDSDTRVESLWRIIILPAICWELGKLMCRGRDFYDWWIRFMKDFHIFAYQKIMITNKLVNSKIFKIMKIYIRQPLLEYDFYHEFS